MVQSEHTPTRSTIKTCLILVVEDEAPIRNLLVELIEEEGHHAIAAENGAEALECLRTSPRPDLILLDVMMPVMDGARFRYAQLQQPEFADIPVVIMSAYLDAVGNREALQAVAFLPKPFSMMDLINILDVHCS
jgi:CheY-like chemotaxis protein